MKFTTILTTLAILTLPAFAQSTFSVTYDDVYSNGASSLSTTACSNGVNGLETRGYTAYQSIPNFPFIGGVPAINSWNSPACGTCWKLTYATGSLNGTVHITGMDTRKDGFNLSLKAMNALTNGFAQELGRISANATQVPSTNCGFLS